MKKDCTPEFVDPKPHDQSDNSGITNVPDVEEKHTKATAKKKKAYEKPAFRYEKVFVTTALSCGKLAGTCGSMTTKVS